MAMAPWAKLKMPEVVYVTTRPEAAMKYTPPDDEAEDGVLQELLHSIGSPC